MDATVQLVLGFETVAGAVVAAGTVVLLLMLLALGTYAYKHFQGDGISWPDETEGARQSADGPRESPTGENSAESDLERGSDDDEWDYY